MKDPRKEDREANKLAKRIRRQIGEAIADFNMIEEGDRVMVCLSGGKDSYGMLDMLMSLQQRAPVNFELIAVNLDQKQPGFPERVLPEYLEGLGVPFRIVEQDTYSIVKRVIPEGKTMCSLCSRLRRGVLYRVAGELGATKIALGHHRDDVLATFFLNLFHAGTLKAMPAKLLSDDGKYVVIRPLAYVAEEDLSAYAEVKAFPIIPCTLCGSQENLQRKVVGKMLKGWEKGDPGRISSILRALTDVRPSQLLDRKLFDFAGLKPGPGKDKRPVSVVQFRKLGEPLFASDPVIRTGEPEEVIDALLARVGSRVACATPLGLGKPVPLLNALYARVKGDAKLNLSIFTALSLEVPRAKSDLERRFLEPFAKRVFDGVPQLDYLRDLRAGGLPANIELNEFYFRPGAMLGVPSAQQGYISSNYTHAARDMLARGVNVVLIMVAERGGRYSLSCNPDLTIDVVAGMRARGAPCMVAGMVNRKLPFMTGEAEVGEEYFDLLLDAPRWEHRLFGAPNPLSEPADHAIGLHAATLVKDGGTLQLGIGSLGDSVAHWLRVRHQQPEKFRSAAGALDTLAADGDREFGRFAEGLFGSSEMFTWGLMTLYQAGVIRRRDDSGHVLQGAFFLGPEAFYQALRELPEDERRLFRMTSVARVNDFFGEEEAARRRLRDARFINITMKATLFGAAASDGLEDGRVVSGVGGQYNFVAMAHELAGARSILLLRSTRETGGGFESNILYNYGHATIPRHLRDIVVTEYGIADLRGKTDAEVAGAMIAIADRRFQATLAARAIAAGKLPRGWRVPERALVNTPQALAERLAPLGRQGLLPAFPLGTDFDADEQRLVPALGWLKENTAHWRGRAAIAAGLLSAQAAPADASTIARMGLDAPRGLRERLLRRLVVLSLRQATLNK